MMSTTGSVNNPNNVLFGNKGWLKIDGIELAELKDLEIKMTADTKELGLMNSATKGEVTISYKGTITFELNKTYSRFKPAILESAKNLTPFIFTLEANIYTPNEKNEETIYISDCWIKGDINLFSLKSENDFLTEKYEAGFQIEKVKFSDTISDNNTWVTQSVEN